MTGQTEQPRAWKKTLGTTNTVSCYRRSRGSLFRRSKYCLDNDVCSTRGFSRLQQHELCRLKRLSFRSPLVFCCDSCICLVFLQRACPSYPPSPRRYSPGPRVNSCRYSWRPSPVCSPRSSLVLTQTVRTTRIALRIVMQQSCSEYIT